MRESRDHFCGRHHDALHTTGPLEFLNPTKKYLSVPSQSDTNKPPQRHSPGVAYVWRSRDNRKGRHAVVIAPEYHKDDAHKTPKPTNSLRQTLRSLGKFFVRFPFWDVSYDVGLVFTVGSAIWVINGFFVWLPVAFPTTEFSGESDWGGGLTAFLGATVFEFGSVLLMLEAVNENRTDCFGWAIEESLDGFLSIHPAHGCRHSHSQKKTFIKGLVARHEEEQQHEKNDSANKERTWSWWPTWYELRTHYFREIGFLACLSQMIGATIFWIAGITSLPPILNNFSLGAEDGAYWAPQVIGGSGFIISSALFMLEVQPRWYIPAPGVLGWHVGLWNLVGAIGFTLCGALGFGMSHPGVTYALTLSTFIGSWAFLIGSVIQWYESLDKYPIWVDDKVQTLVAKRHAT